MNKITQDLTIHEVLQMNSSTAEVFLSFGMHCVGCPGARGETVAQAALKHGANLEEMLNKLNEAVTLN